MKVSIIGQPDNLPAVASAICQPGLVAEVMLVNNEQGVASTVVQDLRAAAASVGSDTKVLAATNFTALAGSEIIILQPSMSRFSWTPGATKIKRNPRPAFCSRCQATRPNGENCGCNSAGGGYGFCCSSRIRRTNRDT